MLPTVPTITIGGIPATVLFAGLVAPGEFQFNMIVPNSAPVGDNTLTATYNGFSVQSGLFLSVGSGGASGPGIEIVCGNSQTSPVNQPFPSPLVVKVVDAQGNRVVGASVNWAVSQGGATLANASAVTNANGQASASVTAGSAPGPVTITVSTGSTSVKFTLTVGTPGPGTIVITGLSSSTVIALTPLYVSTSGLDVSAPVTLHFSDTSGYSATVSTIRVTADGTIVAGVPLYVNPTTGQTGSGAVTMVVNQNGRTSQSTAPVTIEIQDLPALNMYGAVPGQITHAILVFDAILLGR